MKIEIIECRASGKIFSNLTPGSVHETVPTPKEYKHKKAIYSGVWVMGVGEPVKVLSDEYKVVEQ